MKEMMIVDETQGMIACIWRCITQSSSAQTYLAYLDQEVIPSYRSAAGNRGVYILKEINEDLAYFLLLSFWETNEAFVNFAGQDLEISLSHPEHKEYLLAYESTIKKYHVVNTGYESKQ